MEDNFWTLLMIFEDFRIFIQNFYLCGLVEKNGWNYFCISIHMIIAPPLTKYTHSQVS